MCLDRLLRSVVLTSFLFNAVIIVPSRAENVLGLPKPGTMVELSSAFTPVMIKGLKIHPENPLLFDFIVSQGQINKSVEEIRLESDRQIKYFLASLAIPDKDLWVNLSPYEKDRIIPDNLGQTELGRDMLAQDYILKQLTASMIYPEKDLGKTFWDKVYTKARQMYGATQVPVNTFNKVWIVADKAKVFEHQQSVFVVSSHLKVMLEEDYMAMAKSAGAIAVNKSVSVIAKSEATKQSNSIGSQIVREIILPQIEEEVNQGKNFANLRQIYNAMILAVWFKDHLKQSLLGQVYANSSKTNGVDVEDKAVKEKIYQQYLEAYKKGVFNYIKEEPSVVASPVGKNVSLRATNGSEAISQTVPRKYFSGGLKVIDAASIALATAAEFSVAMTSTPKMFAVSARLKDATMPAQLNVAMGDMAQGYLEEGELPFFPNVNAVALQDAAMAWGNSEVIRRARQFGYSQTDRFNADLKKALKFLGRTANITINIVRSPDHSEEQPQTFGTYFVDDERSPGGMAIYIEQSRIDQLLQIKDSILSEGGSDFDVFVREFIFALTRGRSRDKRKMEFQYALKEYPKEVEALYPSLEAMPERMLEKVRSRLLNHLNREKILAELKEDIGFMDAHTTRISRQDLDLQTALEAESRIQVVDEDEDTRAALADLEETAQEAVYKIAVNRLNRVSRNVRPRLHKTDLPLDRKTKIRMGVFFFAANPITLAHEFVAMLKTMADNNQDYMCVGVTKGDWRKSPLKLTFSERYELAKEELDPLFGGLIEVMPPIPGDEGLNGEEKVLYLRQLNKDIRSLVVDYVAGGDHFFAFSGGKTRLSGQDIKGPVRWERVTKDNFKDFLYYLRLKGYRDLFLMLRDHNLTPKHIAGLEDLQPLNERLEFDRPRYPLGLDRPGQPAPLDQLIEYLGSDKLLFNKDDGLVWKDSPGLASNHDDKTLYLPVLDTVGKLFLIAQQATNDSIKDKGGFFQLNMVSIARNEARPDPIRDSISRVFSRDGILEHEMEDSFVSAIAEGLRKVDILVNTGLKYDISSTQGRLGLNLLLTKGKFDPNLFRGLPYTLLRRILSRPLRAYLYKLIRTMNIGKPSSEWIRYGVSVEQLFPVNWKQEHEFMDRTADSVLRQPIVDLLQDSFGVANSDVHVSHLEGDSDISVYGTPPGGTKQLLFRVRYRVVNTFSAGPDGGDWNIGEWQVSQGKEFFQTTPYLTGTIKNFMTKAHSLNIVHDPVLTVNSAMVSGPIRGGIDLNSANFNLQSEGKSADFTFDPVMVEEFKKGHFTGFVPVIINVVPIPNIMPFIGLKEEESRQLART